MLETPLDISDKILGCKILGIQTINVNRNLVEQQLVGVVGNFFSQGNMEINGTIQVAISGDNTFPELLTKHKVPNLKILMKNYFILKDCYIESVHLDVNTIGSDIAEVKFKACNIELADRLLVHFKDIDKVIDMNDYWTINEIYGTPEDMTLKEFKKCCVIERL
jgi:hypothetical protein